MKIGKVTNIETTSLEMPYTKPLVTATNNFTVARGILVKVITEGGIEGYGYSDLFPRTGETPQTAQHVIDAVLNAKVVGKELEDLPRIRSEIDHVLTGNPRAKAALDSAMYDALARAYHMPLFVMLGGKFRSEVSVIKMVSVGQPEAMAEEAKQLAREGLSLKLKVSGKVEKDLSRVAGHPGGGDYSYRHRPGRTVKDVDGHTSLYTAVAQRFVGLAVETPSAFV